MNNKIIILGILFLAILFIISIYHFPELEKKEYQGPVPEGYDEQYFRETGITKQLTNLNN